MERVLRSTRVRESMNKDPWSFWGAILGGIAGAIVVAIFAILFLVVE